MDSVKQGTNRSNMLANMFERFVPALIPFIVEVFSFFYFLVAHIYRDGISTWW